MMSLFVENLNAGVPETTIDSALKLVQMRIDSTNLAGGFTST